MAFDNTFFATVALVLFLALALYAGAFRKIALSLDERSAKISKDIDDARKLREEAESLLAEYKKKRADAETEAQTIVAQARKDAENLSIETRRKLAEMVARRTKEAERRIAQAETNAVRDVRAAAAELAVQAASGLLKDQAKGAQGASWIDSALRTISTQAN